MQNHLRHWIALTENDHATLPQSFNGTKIVDSSHQPLIVYHGTDDDVTKFNLQGTTYLGIYFSSSRKYASEFGRHILSAYINLRHPFVLDLDNRGSKNYASTHGEIVLNGNIVGFYRKLDHEAIDSLTAAGYDGIVAHFGVKFFEVVAFDPNQVSLIPSESR
jgi:ADP-ribosyltransferase-like protein